MPFDFVLAMIVHFCPIFRFLISFRTSGMRWGRNQRVRIIMDDQRSLRCLIPVAIIAEERAGFITLIIAFDSLCAPYVLGVLGRVLSLSKGVLARENDQIRFLAKAQRSQSRNIFSATSATPREIVFTR